MAAGTTVIHMTVRTWLDFSSGRRASRGEADRGGGANLVVAKARRLEMTATPMNVGARPMLAATPPTTGAAIDPASLIPKAMPIITPRRPTGATSSSHTIAAVKHAAPVNP